MDCREARSLIDAYLDGELGIERNLELERHLAGCPDCSELVAGRRTLSQTLRERLPYERAPAHLRGAIAAALAAESGAAADAEVARRAGDGETSKLAVLPKRPARVASRWQEWGRLAATFVIAAGLGAAVTANWLPRGSGLEEELVASDVRGLLAENRMIDVASADEHTVKPWFDHKLDFSPPVKDLTAVGYPLVGGRADYVAGRVVAALVYRHRQHVITLFIWPSKASVSPVTRAELKGENLVHWSDGEMTYWAVSDLNAADLADFAILFRNAAELGEPASGAKKP